MPGGIDYSAARVADIDYTRAQDAGSLFSENNVSFRGGALTLGGDFGLSAGGFSSVAGVRIDGDNNLVPSVVGFATLHTTPEPSTLGQNIENIENIGTDT